ncbi:MAG: hypothetical protein Kow00121_09990 [Elainellaceae cyanobacterium]
MGIGQPDKPDRYCGDSSTNKNRFTYILCLKKAEPKLPFGFGAKGEFKHYDFSSKLINA